MPGVIASQGGTAASYSAEYQAVYNAYTTKPASDTAAFQNTLASELVAAGVWAEADVIYVTANGNITNALLNWFAPTGDDNLTNTTATPFTKYEGFTGASATEEYMSTNFNPSTEGVKYTLDDCAISVYTRIDIDALECAIGVYDATNYITLYPRYNNEIATRINSTETSVVKTVASSLGLSTVARTSSSSLSLFRGSTNLGAGTQNSGARPNGIIDLFRRAEFTHHSNNQISFVFIGGSLSEAQVASMNTAVEKYMDAIGKGVQ